MNVGPSLITFFSHFLLFGGRAFGPPLCGGTRPATPPSKTSLAAARVYDPLSPAVHHHKRVIRRRNGQRWRSF